MSTDAPYAAIGGLLDLRGLSTEMRKRRRSSKHFIHKTWTHNQLRDEFNTVESIQTDPRYQKFLRWLQKQHADADFTQSVAHQTSLSLRPLSARKH